MFLHARAPVGTSITTAVERLLTTHRAGQLDDPASRAVDVAHDVIGAATDGRPASAPVSVQLSAPRAGTGVIVVPMRWTLRDDPEQVTLDADVHFRARNLHDAIVELRGVLRPPTHATAATAQLMTTVGELVLGVILEAIA